MRFGGGLESRAAVPRVVVEVREVKPKVPGRCGERRRPAEGRFLLSLGFALDPRLSCCCEDWVPVPWLEGTWGRWQHVSRVLYQ